MGAFSVTRVQSCSLLMVTVALPPEVGVPVQFGSAGPKTLKLMVPVGLVPPARGAASERTPAAVAPGAPVVTGGEAALTVLVSLASLQRVVKPLLLASPE